MQSAEKNPIHMAKLVEHDLLKYIYIFDIIRGRFLTLLFVAQTQLFGSELSLDSPFCSAGGTKYQLRHTSLIESTSDRSDLRGSRLVLPSET